MFSKLSNVIHPSATTLLLSLAAVFAWTGSTPAPAATSSPLLLAPVDLGRAGAFVILAKSGVATVPASNVTGRIGLSPAPASYLTGFSITMHSSNRYATSAQVQGKLYAADFAPPIPNGLTMAVLDMEAAYTDAAGRAPGVTELGAGDIGGLTLGPGVYKWGTGVLIPTDVTLSGNSTDVWIFQIAQDLTISSGVETILSGGAKSENVFWQVTGLVDVGTTARVRGNILSATGITLGTGAAVHGRLLAQTAVSLDSNQVVAP